LWGLEGANLQRGELLDGIVEESRLGRDFWLTDAEYFEIISRALARDPALGLAVGQREGSCLALGAAGLHVALLRSFSQAAAALVRLNPTLCDRQDVCVSSDDQTLTVQFGPLDAPLPVRRFLTEVALASIRALLAQFVGGEGKPLEVLLDFPAPAYAANYGQVFNCDVRFDQPRAALVVPRAVAERSQLLFQPALAEELGRLAELSLQPEHCPLLVAERLRLLLRQSWKSRTSSMSALATELGLSERSLRRRLAKEGLDFRTILAEDRCALAREMLRDGRCVKETAHELGYASSSAFYKAFRRWAGASPTAFVTRERYTDAGAKPHLEA